MHAEQQMEYVKQAVAQVLALAKEKGATQAEASMSKVEGITASSRCGEVENIEFTNDGGLGISVYVGNKKGSASTADLREEVIAQTVEKAINIASYTEEDPCNGLATAELMLKEPVDLDLYHPIELDAKRFIEAAIECEQAGLAYSSQITNTDGASYTANLGVKVYGNSHGLNYAYPSSRYSLSCMLIAGEGDAMQRDYAYDISRLPNGMMSPSDIGKDAAKATLARLGARKINTQKCPVMFHKDIAAGLIGSFLGAISGGNQYRRSTFLLGRKDTQVLPSWITLLEQPLIPQGLASRCMDSEGVALQDFLLVEQGRLCDYLLDSYSARKLGRETNGHAGGCNNIIMPNTGHSDEDMLQELGTGFLVTELMGQGVNMVTGDYSRGAAGFWVENGEIAYPVQEVTIAGNLADMLMNITAIGKEQERRGSLHTGHILLGELQIAGD